MAEVYYFYLKNDKHIAPKRKKHSKHKRNIINSETANEHTNRSDFSSLILNKSTLVRHNVRQLLHLWRHTNWPVWQKTRSWAAFTDNQINVKFLGNNIGCVWVN